MAGRSPYLAGALLAGLALAPSAVRADLRLEERSTTLDSTVTRWTYIKGDKRAIVTRADTKGVLFNAGARYGAHVEIARPDKELIWELDPQERSYREINGAAFTRLLQKGVQAPRNPNDQPLRTVYATELYAPGGTTAIEAIPTGKTKRIGGIEAEQVQARVVVGVQNRVSGNQLRFTFDQEVWITKDEALLKEVRGFEAAYFDAFGSAVTLQQAQVLAGEWNDAFVTHLRALNDRVRSLGGFPLACTTTVTEEALAQSKDEKSTARKLSVASTEVRKISFDTIPDTEFELPVGYINSDTKVAVGERPAAPVVARATPPAPVTPPVAPPEMMKPVQPAPAAPPVVAALPSKQPAAPGAVAAGGPGAAPVQPGTASERPVAPPAVAAAPVPQVPVVTAPPTNVQVPGGPTVVTTDPSDRRRPRATPVRVDSYTPPPIQNNFPILGSGVARTQGPPPPVIIDEPVGLDGGKKKKRR